MDNGIPTTDGNGVKIQDNVGKIESSNMFQSGGFWIIFLILVLIVFYFLHKRKKDKKKHESEQVEEVPENFTAEETPLKKEDEAQQEQKESEKEEQKEEHKNEEKNEEDFQDAKDTSPK